MKIQLTANSIVALPSHLANIDVGYGYSFGSNQTIESSWRVKLASKIDKTLSFFKPLTTEQKQIITTITESAQFLDSHIPSSQSHLDEMKIQINVGTTFNSMIKGLGEVLLASGIGNAIGSKMYNKANSEVGYIHSFSKEMYIGTDLFNKKEHFNSMFDIKESLGIEKAVSFVVYHEAAHACEHTNVRQFGARFHPIFTQLNNISTFYNEDLGTKLELERLIAKQPKLSELNPNFLYQISTLFKEIYADVGGILLQRNKDILEGKHSRENDLLAINSIISARTKEQYDYKHKLDAEDYVCSFDHFTSPGLEYLRDRCDTLPKIVFTQEEIHDIAHQAIEQGISRVLIATSVANKDIIGQLTTLFNIEETSDFKFKLADSLNFNIYNEYMNELKQFAGEDWLKSFIEGVHTIHNEKMIDHQRATWHAAFHPKQFRKDVVNNAAGRKLMDDIFGSDANEEPIRVPLTKVHPEYAFGVKGVSSVLSNMAGIRTSLEIETDNTKKRSP